MIINGRAIFNRRPTLYSDMFPLMMSIAVTESINGQLREYAGYTIQEKCNYANVSIEGFIRASLTRGMQ